MEVTIPINTTATVRVPTSAPDLVREGNRLAALASGIKVLKREANALFLEVGGGQYRFSAQAVKTATMTPQ